MLPPQRCFCFAAPALRCYFHTTSDTWPLSRNSKVVPGCLLPLRRRLASNTPRDVRVPAAHLATTRSGRAGGVTARSYRTAAPPTPQTAAPSPAHVARDAAAASHRIRIYPVWYVIGHPWRFSSAAYTQNIWRFGRAGAGARPRPRRDGGDACLGE
jgi:hypothetical protein